MIDSPLTSGDGRMNAIRIAGMAALAAASTLVAAQQPRVTESTPPGRAFVDQYCSRCHNGSVRAGDLDLQAVDLERAGANAEVGEKVVRKLRARYMPPVGFPRPDEA